MKTSKIKPLQLRSWIIPFVLIHLVTIPGYAQDQYKPNFDYYRNLPTSFPLSTKDFVRVSSVYGYRKHPVLHTFKMHKGVDLAATEGRPVYATGDGIVENTDYDKGYGNKIIIKHKGEVRSLYGHLKKIDVKKGQQVKRGHVLGNVGKTGLATGPHLHYEVWIKKKKIDPYILWKLVIAQAQKVSVNQ